MYSVIEIVDQTQYLHQLCNYHERGRQELWKMAIFEMGTRRCKTGFQPLLLFLDYIYSKHLAVYN